MCLIGNTTALAENFTHNFNVDCKPQFKNLFSHCDQQGKKRRKVTLRSTPVSHREKGDTCQTDTKKGYRVTVNITKNIDQK